MKHYQRFTAGQRLQHGLLMLSFLGLAATGLPLRLSHAHWATAVSHALGGFAVMGAFHRLFALLLSAVFLVHVWQLVRRLYVGRELGILWGPDSLVPQPVDAKELLAHVKWFVGARERPRFGRFTYWEKFDYFAVFWGMLIIGASGYVLWFHGVASRLLPGWMFNVALLIHGEEALLATAFIFAVHFFNSHLRPEKFPMDTVIFTGRVTEEELEKERPVEYERLAAEDRLASLEAPAPTWGERTLARTVGTTAVVIGLSLFALILVAVIGR